MGILDDLEPPPLDIPVPVVPVASTLSANVLDNAECQTDAERGELVAGPSAPHWPASRDDHVSSFRLGRYHRRATISTQTDDSEFLKVKELRDELTSVRAELKTVKDELKDFSKLVQYEHVHMMDEKLLEVHDKVRERLTWARKEFNRKSDAQRSFYNSKLADEQTVSVGRSTREKELSISQLQRQFAKERSTLEANLERARNQLLANEREMQQLQQYNEHMEAKVTCMQFEMESADNDPRVRELREELEESTCVNNALRTELLRRQEEIKRGETLLTKLKMESVKLEQSLQQEQEAQSEMRKLSMKESEQLRQQHEAREARLLDEVNGLRGAVSGAQSDYHRECRISEIVTSRQKSAMERLKSENAALHATVHRLQTQQQQRARGGGAALEGAATDTLRESFGDTEPLSGHRRSDSRADTTLTMGSGIGHMYPPSTAGSGSASSMQGGGSRGRKGRSMRVSKGDARSLEGHLTIAPHGSASGSMPGTGGLYSSMPSARTTHITTSGAPASYHVESTLKEMTLVRDSIHQYQERLSTEYNEYSGGSNTTRHRHRKILPQLQLSATGTGLISNAHINMGAQTDRSHNRRGVA